VVLLTLCAILIPWLLLKRQTRSHVEVAVTIWASAGILLILGAVIFAYGYQGRGTPVWDSLTQAPIATAWFFLGQSGFAALIWLPILVLVWFSMTHGVNQRRGEDLAKKNR